MKMNTTVTEQMHDSHKIWQHKTALKNKTKVHEIQVKTAPLSIKKFIFSCVSLTFRALEHSYANQHSIAKVCPSVCPSVTCWYCD